MPNSEELGYNKRLFNLKSPLSQVAGQDAFTFNANLKDTGIDNLKDNSVKTNSIQNGAVTSIKLAANSVAGSHIVDGAVGQNDIASNVIQGSHVTGSAVAGTHISLNAVTNTKINDYDLAKGTGLSLTVTNTGTAGTWNATSLFASGANLGVTETVPINQGIGTVNLIFIGGIFTGTS